MRRWRLAGAILLLLGVLLPIVYAYILFYTEMWILLLKLTVLALVLLLSLALLWAGYTLARIKPPEPLERIEKQMEKELEQLEKELGTG